MALLGTHCARKVQRIVRHANSSDQVLRRTLVSRPLTMAEREELGRLRKENRILLEERDHPKNGKSLLREAEPERAWRTLRQSRRWRRRPFRLHRAYL